MELAASASGESADTMECDVERGRTDDRVLHLPGRPDPLPYSQFIEEERRIINPDFKPLFAAVRGLTVTVSAPPPTHRQRSVASTVVDLAHSLSRKRASTPVDILHDLDFYLKPGEMTLLLGAPGCGKSVLLKLLANQLHAGRVKGSVTFNGLVPDRDTHHSSVAFVQQADVHFATLTVRETLQFSADCQMPPGVSKKTRQERVEATLQLLGLQHRADTIVGDSMLRGVSGGEKKRVTIGIEWTKSPGPSMEVFRLFDRVLIMTKGEIAFCGPRTEALPYFERLGYTCPPTLNPAEFLLSTTLITNMYPASNQNTPTEEVVESASAIGRTKYRHPGDSGQEDRVDDADFKWLEPSDFVDHYRQSPYHQQVLDEIRSHLDDPKRDSVDTTYGDDDGQLPLADKAKPAKYPTPLYKYCLLQYGLLVKRALIREWRDMVTNRARLVGTALEAFIVGTLFLLLGHVQSDATTRLGLLFCVLAFFTFESLAALPTAIFERPVFYMQRGQKYYHTSPYVLSHLIAEVPMVLIEITFFSAFVYWITGLSDLDAGGRFGYFYFLLILYYLTITPPCLAFLLLFAGFIIPRTDIHPWWIWMYWANPTTYAFQGMASNEFWDQPYHCTLEELMPPSSVCPMTWGTDYGIDKWGVFDGENIKWAMVPALIGWYIIFNTITYLGMRFYHHAPPGKPHMKEVLYSPEEEREMEEFNIKDHKVDEIVNASEKKKKSVSSDDSEDEFSDEADESASSGGGLLKGGAYLSWQHLNYTVFNRSGLKKQPLQLLHDVSGFVKPGNMLALMGSSGAGKSTLMDVLARRKTGGKITGEILVNGRPTDGNLSRIIGYVEQQDLHVPTQTILEAIEFSAFCRLPHYIPRETKRAYARSLLKILGLEKKANRVIGNHAGDGISNDERKRVTMGVEMAADPAILFLDEPTSGLDSLGAERVMRAIKNIAARGTSVICTIHQPSKAIFSMFSHLLLLKKGGYVTYFGPVGTREGDCSTLLNYLASHGHVMDPEANPAEFILEVTGAGITKKAAKDSDDDDSEEEEEGKLAKTDENYFVQAYRQSAFYASADQELTRGIYAAAVMDKSGTDDGAREKRWHHKIKRRLSDRYASLPTTQLWEMFVRGTKSYWRQPEEFVMKLSLPIVMGVVLGTYFLDLGRDQASNTQRVGMLYYALLFSNMGALQLKANLILSRPPMYRERASRTYSSFIYLLSLIAIELPYILINTVTFVVPVYFISGLQYEAGKFWIFFALYLLANLISLVVVYTLCFSAPNIAVANVMAGLVFTVLSMFAGFLIARNKIPDYWIWLHYLDVNMYPIEALLINEIKGMDFHCSDSELVQVPITLAAGGTATAYYCPITTGEQFLDSLGMSADNMLRDSLVMVGWVLALFISSAFLLKCVVHQKR
ncbi:ABC2 type transporter superfamily protein [Acanthamoeba castellanii str. Neff]|uniref:ABC2 type transporter superfamily protein n=1 Tax=Acanthamoeba castellanii (strain ATCC 30010 / Neff) TaxID=1257118 RepID=L8GDZ8_ACACF|nr:ABC2 type transporter superfamily protein [Acanthamoeba castellanii str. Neff]ELR10948.1 ABC2 type transporter superfamily protein [Acanthamoeba castellanii str. Neff]